MLLGYLMPEFGSGSWAPIENLQSHSLVGSVKEGLADYHCSVAILVQVDRDCV